MRDCWHFVSDLRLSWKVECEFSGFLSSKGDVPGEFHSSKSDWDSWSVWDFLVEPCSSFGKAIEAHNWVIGGILPWALHLGSDLSEVDEAVVGLGGVIDLGWVHLHDLVECILGGIKGVHIFKYNKWSNIAVWLRWLPGWNIFPLAWSNGELLVHLGKA